MADNFLEIEAKLYVPDLETVAQRLEQAGAQLLSPRVYEMNVRFDHAERSIIQSGIVLRLRQDTRVRLTYKSPGEASPNGVRTRFEVEVEVGDFKAMEKILGQLGYYPFMRYEKYRTTYGFENTEVVLDEMPYGNFVEIEGEVDSIERVISRLELENAPRSSASYSVLFDYVCRNLRLDFRDLTFANFKGIAVPFSAFTPPHEE